VIDQPGAAPVSSIVTCSCGDCRNAAAVMPQMMARAMTIRAAKTNIVIVALLRQRLPCSLTNGDCSGGKCRNLKYFTPQSCPFNCSWRGQTPAIPMRPNASGSSIPRPASGREREAPADDEGQLTMIARHDRPILGRQLPAIPLSGNYRRTFPHEPDAGARWGPAERPRRQPHAGQRRANGAYATEHGDISR
jgi:hypothetical protein